jgi:hypothetical protein
LVEQSLSHPGNTYTSVTYAFTEANNLQSGIPTATITYFCPYKVRSNPGTHHHFPTGPSPISQTSNPVGPEGLIYPALGAIMVFLPLVPNSSTWVLFLRCDSGGQVGRPCPQGQRPVLRLRSNIPVLVAPSKIFATSLLGSCQMGFCFPGSLDLSVSRNTTSPEGSHSRW